MIVNGHYSKIVPNIFCFDILLLLMIFIPNEIITIKEGGIAPKYFKCNPAYCDICFYEGKLSYSCYVSEYINKTKLLNNKIPLISTIQNEILKTPEYDIISINELTLYHETQDLVDLLKSVEITNDLETEIDMYAHHLLQNMIYRYINVITPRKSLK